MPKPGCAQFSWPRARIVSLAGLLTVLCLPSLSSAQKPQPVHIRTVRATAIFHDYCAACHGADAKGDGPAAPALKANVPDLTMIAKRSNGKFPRERIREIIEGTENTKAHGSREMPVWGPVFHEIDVDQDLGNVRVDNLLRYLESLQQK